MKYKGILLAVVAVILIVLYNAAFIVDETEQVIVTQFGKIIGEPIIEPGLHFKVPVLQNTNYFAKNLLEWDGDPGQIPTLEKTYIWVDAFARWKIVDPVKYFQTVTNITSAHGRLDDIIDPAVRNFITSYKLIETVRSSNRKLDTLDVDSDAIEQEQSARQTYSIKTGRTKILAGILAQAGPKLAKFGIELVDVQIKRINYVREVRDSVYGRMVAERNQIAEKFRSEGKGEARKILGEKERELKRITSEAYKSAQEIKGKADASATSIYAEAFLKDPEFYSFTKTLEIYNEALDKENSLVLSTDSEFFQYLKGYAK